MKKFIKGRLKLDKGVTNYEDYEKQHRKILEEILEWSGDFEISLRFGTSNDNSYLCEYKIVGFTMKECKELQKELKLMLKNEWKKMELLLEIKGDIIG